MSLFITLQGNKMFMAKMINKPSKWLLILGGIFILLGILLRMQAELFDWSIVFFAAGGSLKVIYLVIGVSRKILKIGWEIILLFIGVSLVMMGVFFKNYSAFDHLYRWFILFGVICKVSFLVIFVRRQKLRK